jgi:hypothetical protein
MCKVKKQSAREFGQSLCAAWEGPWMGLQMAAVVIDGGVSQWQG